MGHPKYSEEDFLRAALAIVAERGVPEVTVAAVSERLGSPTGSFYHRFASRDALLGSLWLRAVLQFQAGMSAALETGPWLAGQGFTLADIAHAPYVTRLDHLKFFGMVDRYPRVADWYERMRGRATYQAALAAQFNATNGWSRRWDK